MIICVMAQAGVLKLQRHAIGITQNRHRLAVIEIDAVQGRVQLGDLGRLELAGDARVPSSASFKILSAASLPKP